MQTLGLATSDSRSEGRLKSLFWPSVRSDTDVDYLTTQGFWICFFIAAMTLVLSVASGSYAGVLDSLFFYLGGNGVRRRSLVAAICIFVVYLLHMVALGYSVITILFCALLLANVRAIRMASKWRSSGNVDESPAPLSETFGDKLSDMLPAMVWPKTRLIFYVLAALKIAALGWVLVWAWRR